MRYLPIIFTTALIVSACSPKSNYERIEGKTMGTSYHITFKADKHDVNAIKSMIDTRLHEVNQSMSTYIEDSTISKFNRLPSHQSMMIDKDFKQVLGDSKTIFIASNGSFDPTVYPLVELWGFGSHMSVERLQSPPTDEEINNLKNRIGLDKVVLQADEIHKTHDGVGLDFSAIAKGYGVDVIASVLSTKYGINDYMVEIGGEIATKGNNEKGRPWKLAIDSPVLDSSVSNRKTFTTITQPAGQTLHVATSGGYRNSVMYDGMRYSHTINPKSAKPVTNPALSVTVLHDSTALADGWATALTATSYNQALVMANQHHIKALFIIESKDGKGFELIKSNAIMNDQTPN
ncbi:FAD:protein FMN transferase [Moraxella sp. Tifton1]|uniref:FAD:protein FMN transferase n=1 Tax=Moraxella oculi TaxID=2940516 RepID=UPI0020128C10|nr:FAD:protein FMN transferase [Moraxella sp. Tifton1]MCL1623021.1 FAD:protein FMN transferase [Moraxella sp. Tifton1]